MLSDLLQIALIIFAIFLAILTIELKDMLHSIMCFGGMCVTVGIIFWLLNAPYVAVFQLLVYAGAMLALFLATIMLTTREEELKNEN